MLRHRTDRETDCWDLPSRIWWRVTDYPHAS